MVGFRVQLCFVPRLITLVVIAALSTGLGATHFAPGSSAAVAADPTPGAVLKVLRRISVSVRADDRWFTVTSSAMEPALRCARPGYGCLGAADDKIVVRPYGPSRLPVRGDIVVFTTPPGVKRQCGMGGTFVKRIVGLPGERLEFRFIGGLQYVFVNGRRLREPYVPSSRRATDGHRPVKVPNQHYFVLGDRRSSSCDSAVWGSLSGDRIIGRTIAIYWPPARARRLGPD